MAEIHRSKLKVIQNKLNDINIYLHLIDLILPDLLKYKLGEADSNRFHTLLERLYDSRYWYYILGIYKISTNKWMLNSRNEIDSREYSKDVDKLYKNVEQLLKDFKNLEIRISGTLKDIRDETIPEKVKEDLRIASNLPSIVRTTDPRNPRRGGKISIKKSKKRTRTITKNKRTKRKI